MPDGSYHHPRHHDMRMSGFPVSLTATTEMQEAGAAALRRKYSGVAAKTLNPTVKPLLLTSDSALGIAAATAYLAMEQVCERGARDHLQHPSLFGGNDLLGWESMSPTDRATYVQEQAPDYLLGAAAMLRTMRGPAINPVQSGALGMVADSLTALARQLERAVSVQRRGRDQRQEAAVLAERAEDVVIEERRCRENQARAERRKRAKERVGTTPAPVMEAVG